MPNFDKVLEKKLKQIERDLAESSMQEQKEDIARAIEIREAIATKFAGMGMHEKAAEQYQKVYELSKSLAEKLDTKGNHMAGLWYKKAAETFERLPIATPEEVSNLKSRAATSLTQYAEVAKMKGGFGHRILAEKTLRVAEDMVEDEQRRKQMAEQRTSLSLTHIEKPTADEKVINVLSLGIMSHRKRESTLHEAINRRLQVQTGQLEQQVVEHEKLGSKLIRKKEFFGGGTELTTAAEICMKNGHVAQASSFVLMAAQAFEKAGDVAVKKGRFGFARNAYRKAITAHRNIRDADGANPPVKKLKEAFEREIADYIKRKMSGPARTLAEEAAKLFVELGEKDQALQFETTLNRLQSHMI